MFGHKETAEDLNENGEIKSDSDSTVAKKIEDKEEIKSPDAAWDAQVANKKTVGEKVYTGLSRLVGATVGVAKGILKLMPAVLVGGTLGGLIAGPVTSALGIAYAQKKFSKLGL